MIRFGEYERKEWDIQSIDDRKEIAERLRQFSKDLGGELSDNDIRDIINDYDFIASGRYKEYKGYLEILIDDFHKCINGSGEHERLLYKTYARLLKENGLWSVFVKYGLELHSGTDPNV